MAGDDVDPRMMSVKPRLRYNTIGGVNGPLVILENVRMHLVTMGGKKTEC
jgi:V-type H+-transporting ATPase subunit B